MINLSDDRVRQLIKFLVHKLPAAGPAFQDKVGEFYKLTGDTESGTDIKNLLTKRFDELNWKPELSDEDMITLAKKVNYGPLYYAIAKRISPKARQQAFPEIAGKFEDSAPSSAPPKVNASLGYVNEEGMFTSTQLLCVPEELLQQLQLYMNKTEAAGAVGSPGVGTATTTANTAPFAVPLGSLAPSSQRGPSYDLKQATKKKKKVKKKSKGKL